MTIAEKFIILQKISINAKINFTNNLRVMIKSGLSLTAALKTLFKQTKDKKLLFILEKIIKQVEAGDSFSVGLSNFPRDFSSLYINMVIAGEKSGKLEEALQYLANHLRKTRELKNKIKSALIYPIFLLVLTVGVIIFILVYVVPKITALFSEFSAELPWATKALIDLSYFVRQQWWLILSILIILAISYWRINRSLSGKLFFHRLYLKLPLIGGIIKKDNLASLSRTFTALLSTDISVTKSLRLTAQILNNVAYRQIVERTAEEVEKGVSIYQVFERYPDLFSPLIIQMVMVGEKTGTLDNILSDLTEYYEEEVSRVVTNLSSIIEPIIIVLLGIVIAGIAVAVIMPTYSLSQQM
ncbi:MAG: type II secretion system F family protein [Candidatus Aenigmarchaeota archaeon]|nr:type II secretion system F family protein [Candidatus Aenigmarchaeota archaeon]